MDQITNKLLESIKQEINTDKNRQLIIHDIIKPIIEDVFIQIYPYVIGVSFFFISMILIIFIILFLNIKICYSK